MEEGGEGVHEEVEPLRLSWQRRPFARTFDLIQQEYGWTDEQVMALTMSRMRQIRSVIWERREQDREREVRVQEMQAQVLAQFIAGAQGWKEGVKAAGRITFLPKRKVTKMIDFDRAQRMFGPATPVDAEE